MLLLAGVACTDPVASGPVTQPLPASPTVAAVPLTTTGGSFRYALAEPTAIVPLAADGTASLAVVDTLFDSLTAYGADLAPIAAAAISWSSSPDFRAWTFTLREGANFHDGTAVTAADFKFAWEETIRTRIADQHLADIVGYAEVVAGTAPQLAGVRVVDPRILAVQLSRPVVDFPSVVAHPALGPVPSSAYQADPVAFAQQPIGNGPFAMAGPWAHDQFVRVARFDDWRNGPRPRLDEVVFEITDPDAGYIAFQQERVEFADVPAGALQEASATFGRSVDGVRGPGVITGPTPVLYYLAFDVDQPPFDQPEVRRAVSLAIDRAALANWVLEGNVDVARSAVPRAVPGATLRNCSACRFDPAAAAQVFAERGIDELTLWFNRDGGHERIAAAVRDDLAQVGVSVAFRTEAFPDYLAAIAQGEAGLFRYGWTADYPTLDEALTPLLHSVTTPGDSDGANPGGYSAPDVDALLESAWQTADNQERAQQFRAAEALALDRDQAIVPLFSYRHRSVASARVVGLRYNALSLLNLAEVSLRPLATSTP